MRNMILAVVAMFCVSASAETAPKRHAHKEAVEAKPKTESKTEKKVVKKPYKCEKLRNASVKKHKEHARKTVRPQQKKA